MRAVSLAVVLAAACAPVAAPSLPPVTPAPDACRKNIDCGQYAYCSKRDESDELGRCVEIECPAVDPCCRFGRQARFCGAGVLCDPLRPDDACGPGASCTYVDGTGICGDPLAPDRCEIEPRVVVARHGAAVRVRVLGVRDDGRPAPFARFDTTSAGGVIVDGVGRCDGPAVCRGVLYATSVAAGHVSCTADVVVVPAEPRVPLVVLAREAESGAPLVGARVVAASGGAFVEATSIADGLATFGDGGVIDAMTVAADGTGRTTVVAPAARVVALSASSATVGVLSGGADFDSVSTQGEIKLAFMGASLPRATVDVAPSALVGPRVEVDVVLEGFADGVVSVPSSMVLALGAQPIVASYTAHAPAGARIAWGVGGKVRLAEIGPSLSRCTAPVDGGVGAGDTCAFDLAPLLRRFDHHAAPVTVDATSSAAYAPAFNTLLSQSQVVSVPSAPLPDVVAVLAIDVVARGVVPLGLAVARDDPDGDGGTTTLDGVVEHVAGAGGGETPAAGRVVLDYAPPHDGLEGHDLVVVLAAAPADRAFDADAPTSVLVAPFTGVQPLDLAGPFLAVPVVAFDGAALDLAADGDVVAIDVVTDVPWRILVDAATLRVDLAALVPPDLAPTNVSRVRVTAYDLGDGDACPATYDDVVDLGGGDGADVGRCARAWSRTTCVPDGAAWTCATQ